MDVRISFDASRSTRAFRLLYADQLPYATSIAINDTAKYFQSVQVAHQRKVFTIRKEDFNARSVKIKPFANKRMLVAVVQIDPPGGRKDLFAKFEDGGIKTPRGNSIAIPAEARRGKKTGIVQRSQRPKAFNLREVGSGPKATVYAGDKRTFMIRYNDGHTGGIYQRTGRKGSTTKASSLSTRSIHDVGVKTLYRFTPEARIDSRLKFEKHGTDVIRATFAQNFDEAFARAIASGRVQIVGKAGGEEFVQASKGARRIGRSDVKW